MHHLNGLVTNTSHLPSFPSLFFVSLSSFLHLFSYCIQPNSFKSVLGAVVEGGLHYMHLLMSSRVATRMVRMVQGTVGTLQDFILFFE